MRKQIIYLALGLLAINLLLIPVFVLAQAVPEFGLNYAANIGLGAGKGGDIRLTITAIIRVILGFLGLIAVIVILMGGFKWMTAGGGEEKVTEAKQLLVAGIVGLIIITSAFAIANFVISQLVNVTR